MSTKSAAKKVIAKKPLVAIKKATKAVASVKKTAPGVRSRVSLGGPRVSVVVSSGGYRVFGSALEPKHRSSAEIAAAVAALD